MTIPNGTESARPFLPAKDFETSKSFYEALGFKSCGMAMWRSLALAQAHLS